MPDALLHQPIISRKSIMRKLIKIFSYITLVAILLAAGFIIYITNFIDPNDYKDQIKQYAEVEHNIQVDIQGNISWSFFPWIGFGLEDMSIKLPNDEKFATVEKAEAYLSLMALLEKQVKMKGISLIGLNLNLIKDAKGRGNWESIKKTPEDSSTNTNNSASDNSSDKLQFSIANIDIKNASIRYEEQLTNQIYELKDFNLSSENFSLNGKTFPLKLSSKITQSNPQLKIDIDASADLSVDTESEKYAISNLKFKSTAQGDFSKNQSVPIALAGDIRFDKTNNLIEFEELKGAIANMNFSAELASNSSNAGEFSGQLSVPNFDAKKLLSTLGNEDALANLKSGALSDVQLSTSLKNANDILSLPNLSIKLDDTTIDGSVSVNLKTTAIKFALQGNTIDLNNYLNETKDGASQPEDSSATSTAQDTEIFPTKALKSLVLDGSISIDKLITSKVEINTIALKTNAANGQITISELSGKTFDGAFNATASLNVKSNSPTLKLTSTIDSMQAATIVNAFADKELMTGVINANINLTSQGNSMAAIKQSMNGTANFDVTDGVLKDIDLEKQVCDGIAKIRQESLQEKEWGGETPFETLAANFTINNGIIDTQSLVTKTKSIDVDGKGVIDLPQSALDYQLNVTIIGDAEDHACSVNEKYQDVPLPIRCRGKFSDEASKWCRPDLGNMQQVLLKIGENQLKRKVGEKLEEQLGENIDEGTKEKINDALKDLGVDKLFGN